MRRGDATWHAYAAAWFHGPGAALLPALGAGRLFLPGLPVPIGRVALVALALGAAFVTLARSARGRPAAFERRAAGFTLSIILLVAYPACAAVIGIVPFSTSDACFWLAFMAGVTAFVALLRAWKKDLHTLTAVLVALVAMSLILLASGDWSRYLPATDRGWSNVRKRLTTPPDLGPSNRSDPHILHIVLDGMGRSDILQEYGVGQADLADLGASSLRVIPDAVANYPYTYEAFASALNMNYLDELTEALANRPDRRPYLTLVHESAVFRALKHRGYEIWVVGSGFEITAASPLADRCMGCGDGFQTSSRAHCPRFCRSGRSSAGRLSTTRIGAA